MNFARFLAAAVLLGFSVAAQAQAGAGMSRDGSAPADGAITGGSILPGEKAGVPESRPEPERALKRCNELSGTLRDQCLEQERDSSTGATRAPDSGGAKVSPPRDAPPPQNPR